MEGIDLSLSILPSDSDALKVGGDSERTPCSAFAIGAVTDTMKSGSRVDRD